MQGYLTLAIGDDLYTEQALNLALSLKLNDPRRPLCLLTDRPDRVKGLYGRIFDEIAPITPRPGFHGCPSKLQAPSLSPFDETIFIDADCIVVKPDMDRHWAKLSQASFGVAGEKIRSGRWKELDMARVCSALRLDYVLKMNSGLFYFRADAAGAALFETARSLVSSQREVLGRLHRSGFQLSDEPFLGVAAGMHRIEPVVYAPEEGSVMISTYQAADAAFDPFRGVSRITKAADFALLGRFLPRVRVGHSPTVAHFIKLRPHPVYQAISDRLRQHFGVELFAFPGSRPQPSAPAAPRPLCDASRPPFAQPGAEPGAEPSAARAR